MKLTRKTSSTHFRKQTAIHYPGLNKNPAYWGLLEYLLFCTKFDEDSGRILISQERLAKIEGKELLLKDDHYIAEEFLIAFQKDVLTPETFQWSKWNHQAGYCRTITKLDFTYEYNLLRLEEQQKKWHSEGRVYFRDGTKFFRAKQAKEREEIEKEAISLLDKAGCKEARFLLEYLNSLPPHLFTKMLDNLDDARLEACKLKDETKRNCALNTLDSIEDQAKPFYQPSKAGKTVRIFTLNESVLLLPGAVRDVLVQDWDACDLRSSQLAICAFTWDVPLAKDFLNAGGNIWQSLFNHLALDFDLKQTNKSLFKSFKDSLKEALYSTIFGMEVPSIKRRLTNSLKPYNIAKAGELFCSHPIIAAMLKARDEQLKTINNNGGATDCFGNYIQLSAKVSAKSILAQLAQALELYVLFPVVEFAMSNLDAFKITLWLHDGFRISFRDSSKRTLWMKRIQQAVQDRATKIGIPTVLEVS